MTVTIKLREEVAQWLQIEATRRGMTPEQILSEDVETRLMATVNAPSDAMLMQVISTGLPEAFWIRYRYLIQRRRAEALTESEHKELISLSDKSEEITLQRAKALTVLARRRSIPVEQLVQEMGITPMSVDT
jgi:hypothetical protein